MNIKRIIITAVVTVLFCNAALAAPADAVLLDMQAAFKKNDTKTLTRLLPKAAGHLLEPWAAYWELRARLNEATQKDVDVFYVRFANTYAEDRLRADWLTVLGQRRDWNAFTANYSGYRMRDDSSLRCYELHIDYLRTGVTTTVEVQKLWLNQKEYNTGCGFVAQTLIEADKLPALVAWRKSFPNDEPKTAQQRQLVKSQDAWSTAQQDWAAGMAAKHLARRHDLAALEAFAKVTDKRNLSDDMLGWWVRAALRTKNWPLVSQLIDSMSDTARLDATWVYWSAIASGASKRMESIAFDTTLQAGFYEFLATEHLGRNVQVNLRSAPIAPTAAERQDIRQNAGLQRALLAIQLGLRGEGVREWNYEVNLAKGSMLDRPRLAAAEWACSLAVWDRCINTSDKTKTHINWQQRYPIPHDDLVIDKARALQLDPAYVYGLIRQESRFIVDAQSHVGASGLMQVMPATARWTAKKVGLSYSPSQISDIGTNLTLGMSYLHLVLNDFNSPAASLLAAAAYNAGPSRSRAWRAALTQSGAIDAAIWIENIPFNETRDYVKKVLVNTHLYAQIYPQLLANKGTVARRFQDRLAAVSARDAQAESENKDLP